MTELVTPKGKTYKTAFYILLIYMACQLSSFILIIFPSLKEKLLNMIDAATREDQAIILLGYWSTIAFAVALIWMLILISRDKNFWNIFPDKKANWSASIGWACVWVIDHRHVWYVLSMANRGDTKEDICS